MIFQNIDFHNVEELEQTERGYRMWRYPSGVRMALSEHAASVTAAMSTGVELRFRMPEGTVDLHLTADPAEEALPACLYFGSIQGGWTQSTKAIGANETVIHIERPSNMDRLQQTTEEEKLGFSPEVVRVILPYSCCYYLGIDGKAEPPRPEDVPEQTYLAYGSSITHGSLSLSPTSTYPFLIASRLNCDSLNLALAGNCFLEEETARYLVSRKDWTFASVELGVNMMGKGFDEAEFEKRTDRFTAILAEDPRPVFATDIFRVNGDDPARTECFRAIVRRYASDRLIYTDGRELLDRASLLSQDMVHPSQEGIRRIAAYWGGVMEQRLMKH